MSNIDKQALLRAAVKIGAERWRSSGDSVITDDYHDGEKVCFDEVAECRRTEGKPLYAEFIAAANPAIVLALLDELESAEKRIDELSASHSKLRDTIAAIHNTIRMDGGYTPLAAILNAAKRAHEESASAAGIGVKGD